MMTNTRAVSANCNDTTRTNYLPIRLGLAAGSTRTTYKFSEKPA